VQVDPIKHALKPLGTKRLKLVYDGPLSNIALNFNLHRYSRFQFSGETPIQGQGRLRWDEIETAKKGDYDAFMAFLKEWKGPPAGRLAACEAFKERPDMHSWLKSKVGPGGHCSPHHPPSGLHSFFARGPVRYCSPRHLAHFDLRA
jgi:hypothetical protein